MVNLSCKRSALVYSVLLYSVSRRLCESLGLGLLGLLTKLMTVHACMHVCICVLVCACVCVYYIYIYICTHVPRTLDGLCC